MANKLTNYLRFFVTFLDLDTLFLAGDFLAGDFLAGDFLLAFFTLGT